MKLSYDYEELLEELKADIEEGLIDLNGKIFIERETVIAHNSFVEGSIGAYSAIVDYYFPDDDIEGIDGEWMTVKGVLMEMEEINRII